MTITEIFEEIRTLLGEPQTAVVADPYIYDDTDLIHAVRSAIRRLTALGFVLGATVDTNGQATAEFENTHGVLIALLVASTLLRGDLVQKLHDGHLGIYYKSGIDVIDTKTAAQGFIKKADEYKREYDALMLAITAQEEDGGTNHFGGQTTTLA